MTWRARMCLCLHQLRTPLSSIPRGHSLFPALSLWLHLRTTLKTQRRVGLITIIIIALPILLVETHHQRGDAEIMMVKILFYVVPQSASKVNVASSAYIPFYYSLDFIKRDEWGGESLLAYASLLVGCNSLALINIVFRFDPLIYFLFSSSDTVSTPQNLVDTRNCHFFMCCLTLGIC